MAKKVAVLRKAPLVKRTSIGRYGRPKNKSKKRTWKRYNRQGHP